MSNESKHLQGLIALASETSSDKRRELLEQVADLFMSEPQILNDAEVGLIDDILTRVAHDVEMKVRQRLAKRFADLENAPANIVHMLANDEIAVAGPILLRSRMLKDRDLIDIVRERGQDHMLAVTKRENISEVVTSVLVDQGDDTVLVSLAGNDGAQFSRNGLESLVAKSEGVEALQAPLLRRNDLPPDLMHDMFWWVSSALREYILTEASIDEALVDQLLDETRETLAQEFDEGDQKMKRALKNVLRRERQGEINEDFLVQALRQGEPEEFIVAFARLAEIDVPTAQRIALDTSCEAVAVACKACGYSLATFSSIVLLTQQAGQKTRSGGEVAALLELYNKVPATAAKRAMRFWRVRQKATGKPPRPTNAVVQDARQAVLTA